MDGEEEEADEFDCFATTKILDAKYEKVEISDVIAQQHHLSQHQKNLLQNVLKNYSTFFDGGLGKYKQSKVHIGLDPTVPPKLLKPYPIPTIHLPTFEKELGHLVKIRVLEKTGMSEWASPTFIAPKKDDRVCWVSDLRYLNTAVKREQYPIPITQDVIMRCNGYKFYTKLDLTVQYYALKLDYASKDSCTIITPFGKYRYCRLPMGLKISPDVAQSIMEQILHDLDVEVYIDDLGIFSNSYEEHMNKIDQILKRVEDAGFKSNPLKCE